MSALVASGFVGSGGSRLLIVAATVAATGAGVGVVSVLVGRRQPSVERRLAGYDAPPAAQGAPTRHAPDASDAAGPTYVRQAIDAAEHLARRAGLLARTELALDQANLPVRAAELLFYVPVLAGLGFLAVAVVFGPVAGVVAAAVVLVAPYGYVTRRRGARRARFERQLPDALTLLASSLRAGFSFGQALEGVAQEIDEPMRRELQRTFTEVRLGRTMEDALADVAARMGSRDLAWTVMAVRIQREVGGNLAVLLDTVARTMTQREQLRREVRALTAEGRLSAVILSLFPPSMLVLILLVRPSYVDILFHRFLGVFLLGAAVVANVVGWLVLRRIVDIEA